jgi:hypothetical protein
LHNTPTNAHTSNTDAATATHNNAQRAPGHVAPPPARQLGLDAPPLARRQRAARKAGRERRQRVVALHVLQQRARQQQRDGARRRRVRASGRRAEQRDEVRDAAAQRALKGRPFWNGELVCGEGDRGAWVCVVGLGAGAKA